METYVYRIHLEPEPEGGFTITVPALSGCVTWGSDYEHALAMAQDAIACYLASLVKETACPSRSMRHRSSRSRS